AECRIFSNLASLSSMSISNFYIKLNKNLTPFVSERSIRDRNARKLIGSDKTILERLLLLSKPA
ncbi:MAG: hypothetical protein PHO26_11225, partial [Dehalococcoidia bacterium]|nr:hypothetical protein [Dehalococcoidia bacterium]